MSTELTTAERDVRSVLESFLDELAGAVDDDAHEIERFLDGERTFHRTDLSSDPEDWTEDALIEPLMEALGLNKRPGRPTPRFELPEWRNPTIPDFELEEGEDDDIWVIGENKSVNKIEEAEADMQDYLILSWWPNNGIATDGIEWTAYHLGGEQNGGENYRSFTERVSLRGALRGLAIERGEIGGEAAPDTIEAAITEFVDLFRPESVVETFARAAPRELREERKEEVEEFYELYIELLFGESDKYADEYDTHLRSDIIAPDSATDEDIDVFAVTLINRLLFVKFLEKRDVLDEGFLIDRVDSYNDDLPRTLYKAVFEPLFYDLLNTPKPRPEPLQHGWKSEVPYLNGGLFRENIPDEGEFDVVTRTLPKIITDLVERRKLDFELDPAILGSVFEKTINHISDGDSESGTGAEMNSTQKETGAYYTPEDVTQIVNERAVRPKARDEIVEAFADAVANEEEYRAEVAGMELDEMLVKVEDGVSFFARTEGVDDALDRLRDLKVLDPACGSGHFLTSALDELHRVQVSLLKGKHGDALGDETRFRAKKTLALNTIYGVDVERIGVEIAKLRIWLKIVEEEWEREFGRLPNIDMNLSVGNSLVGFPITGSRTTTLDMPDIQDEIKRALHRRLQYRHENVGDKEAIETLMDDEIRPAMDESFIRSLNYTVAAEVDDTEEFDAVIDSIDANANIEHVIQEVQVKRDDGDNLSDEQTERLADLGFSTYSLSARLELQDRAQTLRKHGVDDADGRLVEELRELLEDGFVFAEFCRRPLSVDLDNILSHSFHWPVEFPELMVDDELVEGLADGEIEPDDDEFTVNPQDAKFDLILGNPPYGDLTNDAEETLTHTYRMAGADIAAPFVERQLHLLADDGRFGNVTTLKLAYKAEMEEIQDVLRGALDTATMSCFGKRPSKVFEKAEVRVAIITGQEDKGTEGTLDTSEFIRFDNDTDRDQRFSNIEHRAIRGLVLREDGIDGDDNHIAIPKVGLKHIESILRTLRSHSSLIDHRESDEETEHVVWRRRGLDYFTNPMLDDLYEAEDNYDFHFETELEARSVFLAISSSVFYTYWCAYGDQFHLNLKEVRAFPLPTKDALDERRGEIMDISDRLWAKMNEGFNHDDENDNTFHNYPEQKPIIEEADAVLGDLYGLSDDEIEFVQGYHSEYGRHGPREDEDRSDEAGRE